MSEEFVSIKNSSKSDKDINELKKQTGKKFNQLKSSTFQLHNFDFSKKIFFHPEKILAYKNGERPFPTTFDIDLTNRCNHRCSFCYYAEHIGVESDKPSINTKILKERLVEAKKLGAKGLSFTGGGEPTLHPDYLDIIEYTKNIGFDNGTVTNGSTITSKNVEAFINNLQWIRFSMAGGDPQSYKLVQGIDQFEKIVSNIQLLSDKKAELQSNLNIGIRTLVTPENIDTLTNFSEMIKNMNIDYYQLAPDQFTTDKGEFWNNDKTQTIFKEVNEILSENKIKLLTTTFMNTQETLDKPRTCYAHFFHIGITAEGNVIYCKNARGNEDFSIGNIYKKSLEEIWNDEKTKEIERWVKPNNCGLFCKSMSINNTMEDIIHPNPDMSPNFVG